MDLAEVALLSDASRIVYPLTLARSPVHLREKRFQRVLPIMQRMVDVQLLLDFPLYLPQKYIADFCQADIVEARVFHVDRSEGSQ